MLQRPKRLALLAYLAARPAAERVSRDRILVTFWPELPTRRARGNLRNALYYLRSEIGAEPIVSDGTGVWISPRHLACDAAILLARAPDRPPEALLGIYRGEFLDALHLSGAPDFERWVDRTRAALRARATEIAWVLATRAEAAGEPITAARYARRAAELAVDVEGATQRLIRLLLRAGDRAAAVDEYQRLATRLDLEFGIAPSPETTAVIAPIRSGRTDAGTMAPASPGIGDAARARSLAVLPFEDLSGGPGAYLAQGLGEDLVTALAKVRDVRVVSRTSVRRFATLHPISMRAVRDLLGVDLVLEGSVQLREERCRIAVQLIDARTDEHLWAEIYDRPLTDVFAVQVDVAVRVTRALETELSPREHRRLRRPSTTNVRAWQLYLKGREVLARRTPRDAARAANLFRRALALDERFAPAWVGLADAHLVRASTGAGSLADATRLAKQAIQRALDADPELGEARATRGIMLTFVEPDPSTAEVEYRRSVELSPGYSTAHQWYGNWLCAFGRAQQGLAELRVALDLDPLSPAVNESLGVGLYHLGRTAEAEAQFHETLELDPEYWRCRVGLALCAAIRGDRRSAARELVQAWAAGGYGGTPAEAREAAARLERDPAGALELLLRGSRSRIPEGGIGRVIEIVLLVLLGRHDEATAAVSSGRYEPLGFLVWFGPVLDPLAADPRFRRVMEQQGALLPRWRRTG